MLSKLYTSHSYDMKTLFRLFRLSLLINARLYNASTSRDPSESSKLSVALSWSISFKKREGSVHKKLWLFDLPKIKNDHKFTQAKNEHVR
jgi:hypothetical protein